MERCDDLIFLRDKEKKIQNSMLILSEQRNSK